VETADVIAAGGLSSANSPIVGFTAHFRNGIQWAQGSLPGGGMVGFVLVDGERRPHMGSLPSK